MRIALITAVAALLSLASGAQETAKQQPTLVTTTFTVYGNCGTCKKNIERPFKEMRGVEKATWDKKTKQFTITYDPSVLTERRIKEIIAEQGYDTDDVKASDEAYGKLPKCCRYRDGNSHDEH
ncbi:MAG: copper chaperone [Chlorobiota bacterium]|jgi:copper chaperone CopZ|nr:MAG: copper chaperone [Chlorobiota bacterium]